jgi:ABC-type amino acid transport substrate-binding protein
MKKLRSFVLSAALFIIGASAEAKSADYVVGVEDLDYFPAYSFGGERLAASADHGCAGAILDLFAKTTGVKFEYRPLPVKRLYRDLMQGSIDFKFPDNANWQQELRKNKKIAYSEPLFEYVDGVMVLPSNKGRSKENLKILGTVLGFTPFDFLAEIQQKKVAVSETTDFGALFTHTIRGRMDGAYANVAVARRYLNEKMKQPDALVFDSSLPHTRDGYRLSTLKHANMIEKFSAFLKEKKVEIDTLKKNYMVTVD